MQVSVIVCCHDVARWPHLTATLDSVLNQEYEHVELVFISDGDAELAGKVKREYPNATVELIHENKGLTGARNRGIKCANGDVVAFLDDDAEAHPFWISELVRVYENHDAIAAGGQLVPDWATHRPMHLPEEFDWLIGANHEGFAPRDEVSEVRNTFGSNLSFRRDLFKDLDGFPESMGRVGDDAGQGGETELCARMQQKYGQGVHYSPFAIVRHRVFEERTSLRYLLSRAWKQSKAKHAMEQETPDSTEEEDAYLAMLFKRAIPKRFVHLIMIPVFTAMVGMSYLIAKLRHSKKAPGEKQ